MIQFSGLCSFFLSFQSIFPVGRKSLNGTCLVFMFLVSGFSPFHAFGEEKVLDLGEIEITGEVRRPNINLIYSKKYIDKAVHVIVKDELKKLEKDLLQPDPTISRRFHKKGKSL